METKKTFGGDVGKDERTSAKVTTQTTRSIHTAALFGIGLLQNSISKQARGVAPKSR